MNKYITITMLLVSLLGALTSAQAKPSAPININYDAVKTVSIDETINHEVNVSSNIEIKELLVELTAKSGLTLDESSEKQTFTDIKAGESQTVLLNATLNNTVGYVVLSISATDIEGNLHYKNKVIKYGTGSVAKQKLAVVSTVNDEKLILMPAQVQP